MHISPHVSESCISWLLGFPYHVLDSKSQHFSTFSTSVLKNWNFSKLIIESTQVCICSHRFLIFRFIKSPRNLSLSTFCIWKGLLKPMESTFQLTHIWRSVTPYSCAEQGFGMGSDLTGKQLKIFKASHRTHDFKVCAEALSTTLEVLSLAFTLESP